MRLSTFLINYALAAIGSAVLVAPNSNCAVQCGNVLSSTSVDELSCSDGNYSTSAGQTFQDCISCEVSSRYVDPTTNQSDVQWLLYNLRYAASNCIFGFPDNPGFVDTPCATSFSCGELQNAFEYGNVSVDSSGYGYCSQWNDVYVQDCTQCLQAVGSENYMMNFITVLQAGCDQQPAPGSILGLQGSLFSATPINITNPSPIPSVNPYASNSDGLSLGAKVGIAIGALVFILVLFGCCIVWRGKHRRRATLARIARSSYQRRRDGASNFSDHFVSSPQTESTAGFMSPENYYNHKWYRQNESPSGNTSNQMSFSPYNSQYSSPLSPTGVLGHDWHVSPVASRDTGSNTGYAADETGEDNIEMSPMSENERERWLREVRDIGFTSSPLQHVDQKYAHSNRSDGPGMAI